MTGPWSAQGAYAGCEQTNCDAFAGSVRERLGRRDAFLIVWERGYDPGALWSDFPPRPARLRAARSNTQAAEPACGDRAGSRVHWLNFTDAGRHFHVLMTIGAQAPSAVRRQAWGILNSLELHPSTRPDWPASR